MMDKIIQGYFLTINHVYL